MTHAAARTRCFRVYARDADHHHARIVEETSFEAAAVAYLEAFDLAAVAGESGLRVIVHEVGTGHEHCFGLDPDTGETTPCG